MKKYALKRNLCFKNKKEQANLPVPFLFNYAIAPFQSRSAVEESAAQNGEVNFAIQLA